MNLRPLIGACLLLASGFGAAQSPPLLMNDVTVSQSDIAFTWAGQIWTVSRSGGLAKRLYPDNTSRTSPLYSPDGRWLAFTRISGPDVDIWVAPAAGGEARQMTYHPKNDLTRTWMPDSSGMLFNSDREIDGSSELYSLRLDQVMEKRLAVPSGVHASYSPDGRRLVYNPKSIFYVNVNRRFYRGGSTAPLWIVDLDSGRVEQITDGRDNAIMPMWVGQEIYFLRDDLGSFNLAVYDLRTKKIRRLTSFGSHGITSASYGAGAVGFIRDGRIHLFDVASQRISQVDVRLDPEELKARDERAPRQADPGLFIQSANLSQDRKQTVVESRGEVLLVSGGTARNLTSTIAVAEREPALSPDGSKVAYFSDASGEYELHLRSVAGGDVQRIRIEPNPTFYRELAWSPDGKRISFSDQRLSLWCADLAAGTARKIDISQHLAQGAYHARWSPDGRWLAYAKALPTRVRSLFLWDSTNGRTMQVTDGSSQDESPVFDVSGRYLYFTSSGNARNASASDIGWGLMSNMLAEPWVTKRICVVVLSKSDVSPLAGPLAMGSGYVLDPVDLSRRIVPMPLATRDIVDLEAGPAGSVIVQTQDWSGRFFDGPPTWALHRYEVAAPTRLVKIADTADFYASSGDGSTVLFFANGQLSTIVATAPARKEGEPSTAARVAFGDLKLDVEPVQEWKQLYHEAWRMMRDYFYDPNHHGQDVQALEQHYATYLPGLTRRGDLNSLLARAFGEISVSHLRVGGGDVIGNPPPFPPVRIGMLGADFALENGRYRITKVLRNASHLNENPLTRAPLDQPGIDVRAGDYLLEVDGQVVTAEKNLHAHLAGRSGRPTKIKVGPRHDGTNAREYTVVPSAGENGLRAANRAMDNAELVKKLSGGKLAYVYIAGHDEQGFNDFFGALNAAGDKQGLIIDQRFNGGGITPDVQVLAMLRHPMLAYMYRYGNEITVPVHRVDGPKVLVINEANGSAAETFTVMYKAAKAGTVVGMPTYGGGIGVALFSQRLIDGGSIGIPNRAGYNPLSGQWEIENEGVKPDVRVELMPLDWRAGRDLQLEKAVEVALGQIPGYKKPQLKKPNPPVHVGGCSGG